MTDLLQKLQRGEEGAYKKLFELYYAPWVVYANSLLKKREIAEDLVQEFFIVCWSEKRFHKITDNLENYCYRSIRNSCLNYMRNEKRRRNNLIQMVVDEKEEFRFNLEEMEEKEEIQRAIDRLPPQCKAIFMLCCYEGKKYQEVADRLGLSITTVRTQMARAFKSLRNSLKGSTFTMLLWMCCLKAKPVKF